MKDNPQLVYKDAEGRRYIQAMPQFFPTLLECEELKEDASSAGAAWIVLLPIALSRARADFDFPYRDIGMSILLRHEVLNHVKQVRVAHEVYPARRAVGYLMAI